MSDLKKEILKNVSKAIMNSETTQKAISKVVDAGNSLLDNTTNKGKHEDSLSKRVNSVCKAEEQESDFTGRTFSTECPYCGGKMELSEDQDELVCPYCESKTHIELSSSAKKAKYERDVEINRQNAERDVKIFNRKIEAEEKKRNDKNTFILIGILVVIMLFLMMSLGIKSCSQKRAIKKAEANGMVSIPVSASTTIGKNYEDVKMQFETAGFTNVVLEKQPDLVLGLFSSDGDVASISINGDTEFTSGTYVSSDSLVKITYHTYPERSEDSSSSSQDVVKSDNKISKNGFNSSTNEIYSFATYSVEIPNYWTSENEIQGGFQRYAEMGGRVAMLQVDVQKETDPNYDVSLDGLISDSYNMIKSYESTVFEKIDSFDVLDTGTVEGVIYKGNLKSEFMGEAGSGYGEIFVFPSEADRMWCTILYGESDNTEYSYGEDFYAIINSIKNTDGNVINDNDNADNADNTDKVDNTEKSKQETTYVKVTADSVNVRSQANTDCDVLGKVKSNDQFILLGREGEWSIIDYMGTNGYIKSEFLTAYSTVGDVKKETNAMPVMSGTSLDKVVSAAKKYGLAQKFDDENFGHGTTFRSLDNESGGLSVDVVYSTDTKEILHATIITNKLSSTQEQKDLICGMAGVLCPGADSKEVEKWVNDNIGGSKKTIINGFDYELALGPVDNLLFYTGQSTWEEWDLTFN